MKFNNGFVKATAATALAIAGIGVVNANQPAEQGHVQAATQQVKINYVPGYGINIWTSYNHGQFTGQRANHGATFNVLSTQTDAKGNTWYEIGQNQWIMAKYTVTPDKKVKTKDDLAAKPVTNTKVAVKAQPQVKKTSKQASGNAAAVIALAQAQVGNKYVWGGTTPAGFDCSGLVQYVYKNATGIDVTRTTYSQLKQGRAVALKDAQPGDLLFFGAGHVGIYAGNGQYIHAATPAQGVCVSKLSSYFPVTSVRRVLN